MFARYGLKSFTKPDEFKVDTFSVFIRNNIVETKLEDDSVYYTYDEQEYRKSEYIQAHMEELLESQAKVKSQAEEILELQEALVEIVQVEIDDTTELEEEVEEESGIADTSDNEDTITQEETPTETVTEETTEESITEEAKEV